MRNLFNMPRKAVRTLAARLPFTSALTCEAVAPFLMPFSENALDAKTHARIAGHVASCSGCQTEVQMLGEMADFFRANPPQTAVPAPNLWQSIEAQIQTETPERIAAFNARPEASSIPRRERFDWNSFVRSFAATGGVMTAVVACVWIFAARHPLEPALPTRANSVAANSAETATTIQLIPKRSTSGSRNRTAPVATRAERAPVLRLEAQKGIARRQVNLPLLGTRFVANAPLKRNVVATTSGPFAAPSSQAVQAPKYRPDSQSRYATTDYANRLMDRKPAGSPQGRLLAYSEAARRNSAANAQDLTSASSESSGGDTLPVVRKILDNVLEQATVAAVAASLSPRKPEADVPVLAALPVIGNLPSYNGVAMQEEDSAVVPQSRGARAMTEEVTTHRAARRTQVAWLVEDGARSERSAADATRAERRQQSLFSYGSR